MAQKVMERAVTANEQLAYVRRGLTLLKRFGAGHVRQLGSPYHYDFDPLDPLAEMETDARVLLMEFRVFYWRIRADAAMPAPTEPPMRSETKRRPIPDSAPRGKVGRAVYDSIKQKWGADGGPPTTMSNQDIANALKLKCSAETVRRVLKQRP
jgi:hypothetical protein